MKLSSKSQYGLKACYILALNYEKRSFSASALEKEIGVSGKYLERILRMLSGARIVAAERGVSGGYRLARNPAKITVGDIVRVLRTISTSWTVSTRRATNAPRVRSGNGCTRASTACSIPSRSVRSSKISRAEAFVNARI